MCAGVFLLRASTVRLTCVLVIVENGMFKTAKASRNSFQPRGLYSSRIVCGAIILLTKSNTCEPAITRPLNTNSPEDVHEDSGLALDILSKMYLTFFKLLCGTLFKISLTIWSSP